MKRISLHHEYVLKGTCKDSQLYKMKSRDDLKEKVTSVQQYRLSENKLNTRNEDIDLKYFKDDPSINNVLEAISDITKIKFNLIEVWGQFQHPRESARIHDHVHLDDIFYKKETTPNLCGVYWVSAPLGSGDIVFQYNRNRYHESVFNITPQNHHFCLFKPGLLHYVLQNQATNPRIAIAFNLRAKDLSKYEWSHNVFETNRF